MEADEIIIDLSKEKDGIYNGSINRMGASIAMVMIEDEKLIDINTRKVYGVIKTISGKAKTTGRAWKLYAIDDFNFNGLRFPISGFPNGDKERPGIVTLQMEFNERGVQYCKYEPVLKSDLGEESIADSEVPF